MENKWQKIETAPKDTAILIAYFKTNSSYWTRVKNKFIITEAVFETKYNRWVDGLGRLISDWEAKKTKSFVTHWQPLPQPPKEENV